MQCHKITYSAYGLHFTRYTYLSKETIEKSLFSICPTFAQLIIIPCDFLSQDQEKVHFLSCSLIFKEHARHGLRVVKLSKSKMYDLKKRSYFWRRGVDLYENEFLKMCSSYRGIGLIDQRMAEAELIVLKELNSYNTNQLTLQL